MTAVNMKFLFLFLCITATRSKSIENVTSVTSETQLESASTPELSTNKIDGLEKETEIKYRVHNGDCPQNEESIRYQLVRTSEMLEEGYKIINQQGNFPPETILVLGRAGCGKTSFVQFLAGDNSKLISKEVGKDTGEYLIEDGLKIGLSVTDSLTLYPDQVSFNSSATFCDTPGFRDTRSPSHEVVATNVMKKIVEKFKTIKIVILANYNTLQYGVEKTTFTDLLRYVNNFISNLGKYKANVALIATKVPCTFAFKNGTYTMIQDESIIASIGNYLSQLKNSYAEKLTKAIDENDKGFYGNAIGLLEILGETDSEGKSKKINIFRRPNEPGALINVSLLQQNKKSLLRTVFNNLKAVESDSDDFDYTLSDGAKLYLECLLRYVNSNVVDMSNQVYQSLKEKYRQVIKNYTNLYSLVRDLKDIDQDMDKLQETLEDTNDYKSYLRKLTNFAESKNISIANYENRTIADMDVYVGTLEKFVDTGSILSPSSWSSPMKHVLQYIKDTSHWYQFLKNVFEKLSSYKTQAKKDVIYNNSLANAFNNENLLMRNYEFFMEQIDSISLNEFTLTDERINELDDMISSTALSKNNITCSNEGKLIIKGHFVKISEINSKEKISMYCGEVHLKEVVILAVSTVFIDANIDDESFRGADMLIVAPRWEAVGKREIILDGVDGKAIVNELYVSKDGQDGRPGLPGGNAGHFFGIGLNFINGASLTIKSNGGSGGPGVDGKKGHTGQAGKDGYLKLFLEAPSVLNWNYNITYGLESTTFPFSLTKPPSKAILSEISTLVHGYTVYSRIYVHERDGECGYEGDVGGNGGVGGVGGKPGKQILIEMLEPSHICFQKLPGYTGPPGNGGVSGKRGPTGQGIRCYEVHSNYYGVNSPTFWNCVNTTSMCEREFQQWPTGLSNFTSTGILLPSAKNSFELSRHLLAYTLLLERESNNTVFKETINNFENILNQKYSYDMNTWWKLMFSTF